VREFHEVRNKCFVVTKGFKGAKKSIEEKKNKVTCESEERKRNVEGEDISIFSSCMGMFSFSTINIKI
jgi:hypothetical protein